MPELLAIGSERATWTYGELERGSRNAAFRMLENGVLPGDVVVIDCDRSAELVVLLLAVMRVGAIFLVLGERWPDAYKVTITSPLDSLHWASVGVDRKTESAVRHLVGGRLESYLVLSGGNDRAEARAALPDVGALPAQPMYLASTSGSTGRPKLVLGSHEPVVHFLDWYIKRFAFGRADRFSLLSGLGYDPMLRDIFTALSSGGSVWIPSPEHLHARFGVSRWLKETAISVVHTTPSLAALVFDNNAGMSLPDLKVVALGGEPLSWKRANCVAQVASEASIVNFYGTTETPQAVAYHTLQARELRRSQAFAKSSCVPIGSAIDDVNLLLLDAENGPCAPGDVGEICVRTRHHSRGYYGDPASTARSFVVDPTGASSEIVYRTGDLGYCNGSGDVVFVGRKDRQVKCGGNRLQLEEIEAAIRQVTGARQAFALVENAGEEQARLACYVEASPASYAAEEQIKRKVLSILPSYMLPSRFVCVPSLPLTANGKLDMAALAKSAAAAAARAREPAERATGLHAKLVAIWASVLEVAQDELTADSNFFEVGGSSLLAGRLISAMNAQFQDRFAITDAFLYPKIRDWVDCLARRGTERDSIDPGESRSQKRGNRIAAARAAWMKSAGTP